MKVAVAVTRSTRRFSTSEKKAFSGEKPTKLSVTRSPSTATFLRRASYSGSVIHGSFGGIFIKRRSLRGRRLRMNFWRSSGSWKVTTIFRTTLRSRTQYSSRSKLDETPTRAWPAWLDVSASHPDVERGSPPRRRRVSSSWSARAPSTSDGRLSASWLQQRSTTPTSAAWSLFCPREMTGRSPLRTALAISPRDLPSQGRAFDRIS
mmetsp:Transcript_3784/g.12354  ORF Transcript_3784/g.12354 Transcript_3784/m.12354 type:complete len:206 (-) Transcript_3784:2315-2932(-)